MLAHPDWPVRDLAQVAILYQRGRDEDYS